MLGYSVLIDVDGEFTVRNTGTGRVANVFRYTPNMVRINPSRDVTHYIEALQYDPDARSYRCIAVAEGQASWVLDQAWMFVAGLLYADKLPRTT